MKSHYKVKELNIIYKQNKPFIQRVQDMNILLKRFKKLVNEKFKESKILENIEINVYKLKNEFIETKSGDRKLNIAYPFKEENIEKLLRNRLKL
jgi:hypothetical protein